MKGFLIVCYILSQVLSAILFYYILMEAGKKEGGNVE